MNLLIIPFVLALSLLGEVKEGDILITEILFNPPAGGVDFVEIYNNTGRVLDLRELYIGSADAQGKLTQAYPLSITEFDFHPHTYLVLTTRPEWVRSYYSDATNTFIIGLNRLPAFNNRSGTAIIYHRPPGAALPSELKQIDRFDYHESMHSPFLKNVKGISLERQRVKSDTGHIIDRVGSAAVWSGGATPGFPNSTIPAARTTIHLKSQIISLEGNETDEPLKLHYSLEEPGMLANLRIFDFSGKEVCVLLQHMSVPTSGIWTWNGNKHDGEPLPNGIYTISIELYNSQGLRKMYRKSFVLLRPK